MQINKCFLHLTNVMILIMIIWLQPKNYISSNVLYFYFVVKM